LRPQGAFECGSLLPLLKTLKIHVFHLFIESGSEQPHLSESFALQKVCGIGRLGNSWLKKLNRGLKSQILSGN
jgi:hypothetical protein